MLTIPYVNTMIIYRQFKLDNKVVSQAKNHKSSQDQAKLQDTLTNSSLHTIRCKTLSLLLASIREGKFSDNEVNKMIVASPEILVNLHQETLVDYSFDQRFAPTVDRSTGRSVVVLPQPANTQNPKSQSARAINQEWKQVLEDEKLSLHTFLIQKEVRIHKTAQLKLKI